MTVRLRHHNAAEHRKELAQSINNLQRVVNEPATYASTSSGTMVFDNTIPQNTEGAEMITLSITPKSATSKLRIQFNSECSTTTTVGNPVMCTLFRDSGADAIGVDYFINPQGSGYTGKIVIDVTVDSVSTASTTFKIRAGATSTTTTTLGGYAAADKFGSVPVWSLSVTEYAA